MHGSSLNTSGCLFHCNFSSERALPELRSLGAVVDICHHLLTSHDPVTSSSLSAGSCCTTMAGSVRSTAGGDPSSAQRETCSSHPQCWPLSPWNLQVQTQKRDVLPCDKASEEAPESDCRAWACPEKSSAVRCGGTGLGQGVGTGWQPQRVLSVSPCEQLRATLLGCPRKPGSQGEESDPVPPNRP